MKFKNKTVKTMAIIVWLLIPLAVAVIFIKYDTPAAAQFTDNYLRPILGNNNVIFLEKIYYNLSDKVTQLTYKDGKGPQFTDSDQLSKINEGDLNLNPLKTNSNLPKVNNEGVWFNKKLKAFPNEQILAYTFIRPDPDRPYAYVTLLQADMGPLKISAVAGQKQPGGPVGNPGPGIIPSDIVQSGKLVAAFEGGFQYRDGMYGMIVGDKTYLPLKEDIGTLVGYKDGSFKIVNYTGQNLGENVAFVRQNCPILIENNNLEVVNPKNKSLWGRTPTTEIYTWRSGIGITKEGNLIYAVGNNLSPTTLAYALQAGGATDAIQLDINPFWVRFSIFDYLGNGNYNSTSLMKGVYNGAKQFLGGYEKDFFFLYQK